MKIMEETKGFMMPATDENEKEAQEHEGLAATGDGKTQARPDPEVCEKPARRRFSAEYKLRIISEADACKNPGEVGTLLRREGLYDSHLARWRKKQREGALGALSRGKPGPRKQPENPLAKKVTALERENQRLKAKLEAAETIIEVQKKVGGLLGIPLESQAEEREESE